MIKKNLAFLIVILQLGFIQTAFSQSDYETVQNFKANFKEIENQIKNATSLNELNAVVTSIEQLKQEYAEHRDLLDKSLYPDNYDKSFEKLNAAYLLRQDDFTKIDVLQTEVVVLEQKVEELNIKNNEIIAKIEELEALRNKDKKTIAELENLVADLKNSLMERDKLVLKMMDQLVPPIMREKATLSAEDKYVVRRLENKDDVIENVKISLKDNIRFLEATSLNPNDIKTIQEQQDQFANMWQAVGPKLVDVYAGKDLKAYELKEIDSLFTQWYYKSVDQNVWRSILDEFSANGINLKEFNYGDEFVQSINLFIGDEIKNIGIKSQEASEKTYTAFTDSTWFSVIKPVWIPYLIEGGLFTVEQKDAVEASIEKWKGEVYPSQWWLYVILWVVITAIVVPVILLIIKKVKRSKSKLDKD